MGQKIYYLFTDYKTKTGGTGRDRWIAGKVVKFTSVGRTTPAVRVRWPKDAKLPDVLTHEDFKRYSMMQVGGRYTKKAPNTPKGSTRKLTEHLEPTLPGEGDLSSPGKFSYSTEQERRMKMAQAAAHILFGAAQLTGNVLHERKKAQRKKRRAEYMRLYRTKMRQNGSGNGHGV
jgi:hypothetical protein